MLSTWSAHADNGRLYTADQLSSSMIDYVLQDDYGYIWVGTEYGLNKFDGYRFTHFFNNKSDTTSLQDNDVSRLFVDSKHQLWIGTSKGLSRFDYQRNCFVRYSFPDGLQPRVECLMEDSEGNLLIGSAGWGLFAIRAGQDKITHEELFPRRTDSDFFLVVFEDDQHHLWRAYKSSMISRVKVSTLHSTSNKDYQSPYGPAVSFLRTDKKGFLIVCLYGILRYDYATGELTDAGYDMKALDAKVSIRGALMDRAGNLYLGTSGRGLLYIPKGSRTLQQVSGGNARYDLSTANVNHLFEDKDHNLWVSCYKKGLFKHTQGKEIFNTWKFETQNYVLGSSVSSVAEGDHGSMWCTVQKSGIYHFDSKGKISPAKASPAGANCIYRDKQGRYWVGSENTLYSYDPLTGASKAHLKVDGWGINCMTDDGEGNLYICNYGKGLCVYNIHSGKSYQLSMSQVDPKKGGLCNDWIKALCVDSRGLLWIASASGVCVMNPADRDFKIFGWDIQLNDIPCLSLFEQRNGTMLIGTNCGLYYYDREQKKVLLFPQSKEIENQSVYTITQSANGDLWMSSANGIWQYDHQAKRFINHVKGHGLENREYVVGAVIHSADDRITYGSPVGLISFYPKAVRGKMTHLGDQVYLTNFLIDGQPISCLTDHFKIPYNQNSFTMEFSMLNFQDVDDITFEYRMNKGSWTAMDEGTNSVSFNRMKPGKYVFEVCASSKGVYSKNIRTVTVIVKSPWYSSTLAYLIYTLLALGAIGLIAYYYDRKRKADFDEQKMQLLINATHDIRSPLTLILGPLNKLKTKITDKENQQDIETIDRNAQRLLLLVNQILDERKIDKNQMHLHCKETDLVAFVNGIYSLYQYNAHQRNITFRCTDTNREDPIMVWIDRIQFDKVISNLLSNAFKYTFDGGEINIRITHDEREAAIYVVDSGIGFKDEKTARLFDRFYQGRNASVLQIDGTGIGLNLSRAIVQMHGGQIKAYNRVDGQSGACLEVRLPLGKDHLKPEEIEDGLPEKNSLLEIGKKQTSKKYRLLVVDDDQEVAQYIKNELGYWYKIDIATNGREAMKQLLMSSADNSSATREPGRSYDLVISDVMMPEMDGITMLKQLKSNPLISDIPVILLTSKAEVSDKLEGLKKGADAFLAKPFNMEELHVLVDNLIDNVRRLRGKFTGAQRQEERMENVEVKGNDDALMDRIMRHINENLSNPDFNVERLTEEVGISRAQLHRKMKEITGISAGEFIRNLRLEQAARLIIEGKINVTQVAFSVGFTNQTHFSTAFKKHYGMTPTEYAERARQA